MSSRLEIIVVAIVALVAISLLVFYENPTLMVNLPVEDFAGMGGASICPNPAKGVGIPSISLSEERMYWTAPYTAAQDAGMVLMDNIEAKLPATIASGLDIAEDNCQKNVLCVPIVNNIPISVTCTFTEGSSVYYQETITINAPDTTKITCYPFVVRQVVPSFQKYGLGFLASWTGAESIILSAKIDVEVAIPCSSPMEDESEPSL